MGLLDDYLASRVSQHYGIAPDPRDDDTDQWPAVDRYGYPIGTMDYSVQLPAHQPVRVLDVILGEPITQQRGRQVVQEQRAGIWERMNTRWQRDQAQARAQTCWAVGCRCPGNVWNGRMH